MDCVADTIYYEARGEGEQGMRAIAHVIINRANEEGVSPCIIVRRPNQFAKKTKITDWKTWKIAQRIASNPGWDFTKGATYFHNYSVKPRWSYKLKITYKFGGHVFYKPN
jgi:N-acetylmuramoyl-L-alanine amidase